MLHNQFTCLFTTILHSHVLPIKHYTSTQLYMHIFVTNYHTNFCPFLAFPQNPGIPPGIPGIPGIPPSFCFCWLSYHVFLMVRFISSSPSSYIFFIRFMIPALGSSAFISFFESSSISFFSFSFFITSVRFPQLVPSFSFLRDTMMLLLFSRQVDFSGTIFPASLGISNT